MSGPRLASRRPERAIGLGNAAARRQANSNQQAAAPRRAMGRGSGIKRHQTRYKGPLRVARPAAGMHPYAQPRCGGSLGIFRLGCREGGGARATSPRQNYPPMPCRARAWQPALAKRGLFLEIQRNRNAYFVPRRAAYTARGSRRRR